MDARNDFNGDGRSDILWRNGTGDIVEWLGQSDGSLRNNPNVSGQVLVNWFVTALGDFNGDGRADILWRNPNSDGLASWLGQDGGGFVNNTSVSGQVQANWFVAATGDFNGDGNDDLLWRNNDTGTVQSWLGQDSGGFVNNPGVSGQLSNDWFVAGTGDFNGDGHDDILWRNNEKMQSWLGQDSGGFVNNPGVSGQVQANWFVAATGDFNGDGHDDILWRTNETAAVQSWLGQDSGGFVNNPGVSGQVQANWFVAATGDFNGDGNDDILWRNSDTAGLVSWFGQDSGGFTNNPGVSGQVDLSWEVVRSSAFGPSPWDY